MASLRAGTIGPHWAEQGDDRLAAWAVEQGDGAGWFTLALPRDRSPGAPLRIGDVPAGLDLMRLVPGGASGFVLLTTRRLESAYLVEARHLGPEGIQRSGPHVLGESPAPIVWIDAVPTARGALVVWAERAGARADVYAVPAGPLGPEGRARRLARGTLGWQLAPFGRSAAVATVESSEQEAEIVVRFVADDGSDARPEVRLEARRPGPEIDLAVTTERTLVAWAERRSSGGRILLAELGPEGTLRGEPWAATAPRGEQHLIELVAGPAGDVYLAWEEQGQRPLVGSNVLLTPLGAAGTTLEGPAIAVPVSGYDGTLPVFEGRQDGMVAVTRAPSCDEPPCGTGDVITVAHLGRDLAVRGTEVVRVGGHPSAPAELLWDVRCEGECWALAARTDNFTHVYLKQLRSRRASPEPSSATRSSLVTRVDAVLPRATSQAYVADAMDLVALHGWTSASGTTLAWLSYFDPTTPWEVPSRPAPDGRRAPVRAVLRTQVLGVGAPGVGAPGGGAVGAGSDGEKVLQEETISWRAHSPGGLAWAPGAAEEKLLVWSALDDDEPQVFATVVDAQGRRLRQRMVTRTAGAVLDVAAVPLDSGWLVAWLDGRGDTLEPYAVHLDEKLQSVGAERPVAAGAVSPAGLELLRRGELVFAAWSDVRSAGVDAQGDIFLAVLSALDGSVIEPARRVAATPQHSHSPRLEPRGDGALLAWLDADAELDGPGGGALAVLELDASGRSLGAAEKIRVDGRPTSFDLRCASDCRVVVTVDAGPRSELWAAGWRPRGDGRRATEGVTPQLLVALRGRFSDAAAPLLAGDDVVYVDGDEGSGPALHRLGVRWR